MNPGEAPPSPTISAEESAHPGRRWLIGARAIWAVVALLSLILFVVSVPDRFQELRTVCEGAACESSTLSPENVRALGELGISLGVYAAYNVTLECTLAVIFSTVALIIYWRGSESSMALFFSSMLLTFGLFATPAVDTLLAPPYVFWVPTHVLQVFGLWSFLVAFYVFPNWRLDPTWTRPLLVLWSALMLAWLLFPSVPFNPSVPFDVPPGWALLLSTFLLSGMVAQVYRYARSPSSAVRRKTRWFVFGVTACVVGFILYSIVPIAAPSLREPGVPGILYTLVAKPLAIGTLALIPLSTGIAILKHRFLDIDLIFNRTLVYGALTASVVGLYILVVGGLGILTDARNHPVFSLLATGLAAVLAAPLRERLQRAVNRLIYGERDEPYEVLSRLGRRLESTLVPDAALRAIVDTISRALKLPYAAIYVEKNGVPVSTVEHGTPVEDLTVLPLAYGQETVGRLVVAHRAPGEEFAPSDKRLLEDLARRAGVAVYAFRITEDLKRARERLVTMREEERRRLRRDLHDGLGPRLAAQTLKVGAARSLYPRDPESADALLAGLETDTEEALTDLRRLVYDLRPPALDQLGLGGAIRDTAENCEPAAEGTRVSVEISEKLPPLPAAVEVATYRIVQEALANVVRHANAGLCVVRVTVAGHELMLEVIDDGVGLPEAYNSGVGLSSMRERAAELGGTFDIATLPAGGTRVQAVLPLPDEQVIANTLEDRS